jgi:hypothetical protein
VVLSRSKKGKSQRRGSRSRAIKRTDIKNFRWPPFLQESDMHFLIQRVEQASTDEIEHRLFMTILQRAYEDVLELKTLYHELPGVLTDDRLSTSNFKEIIKRSALIRTDTKSRTIGITRSQCDDEHKVDLGSLGNFLYKPVFFIKPSRLSLIMAGVERVSAGDNGVYNRYLKTIAELWDKTRPLERLYRKALRGIEANDRDPLGEYLRLVARDCRITASHGEEQKDTAVVERSNRLSDGRLLTMMFLLTLTIPIYAARLL